MLRARYVGVTRVVNLLVNAVNVEGSVGCVEVRSV